MSNFQDLPICYVEPDAVDRSTSIYINFTKLLGTDLCSFSEDIEEDICLFSLRKKSNYVKCANMLLEVVDLVFSEKPSLALSYLVIKTKILGNTPPRNGNFYNEVEFAEDLVNMCNNPALMGILSNHIDTEYDKLKKLDSESSSANIELQFTDDHARALLKSSYLIKFVIPLITEYMHQNGMKQAKRLILDTYLGLIKLYSEDKYDIANKLYKLTESRVKTTTYSDSVMWNYLENIGETSFTKIQQFFRTLIIDIIPKLDCTKGTIGFIHSALVQQLKFAFSQKYEFSYSPTTISYLDSDEINPFENLETVYQHDEGIEIMKELEILNLLKLERAKFGEIDERELDYYSNNVQYHNAQVYLVTLWYSKYTKGNYEIFAKCSHRQFVELLLFLYIRLESYNYTCLANTLISKAAYGGRKRHLPSKTFVSEVEKTKDYADLVNNVFSSIKERFEKNNLLFSVIESLVQDKYFFIPDYDEAIALDEVHLTEDNEESLEFMEIEIHQIGHEIVKLFEQLGRS
jgi:hypothetical protein